MLSKRKFIIWTALTAFIGIIPLGAFAKVANTFTSLIKKSGFEKNTSFMAVDLRSNMLIGSMLAGVSFGNSPVAGVHALAYPIGGTYHIPHGLSNALVLPHVLRFNSTSSEAIKSYSELAPIIFPEIDMNSGNQDITAIFIEKISSLSKDLGLEQKLRDVGIPEKACETMAKDAMKQTRLLVNNPKEILEQDAFDIYKSAW